MSARRRLRRGGRHRAEALATPVTVATLLRRNRFRLRASGLACAYDTWTYREQPMSETGVGLGRLIEIGRRATGLAPGPALAVAA